MGVRNGALATLVDVTATYGEAGEAQGEVAEILTKDNPVLEDIPWKEGNLLTGERTWVRTGKPTPQRDLMKTVLASVDMAYQNLDSVEVGVPQDGIGCHLAEIDGYYVSGLVPAEIIERLVTERPKIAGITLPGMPGNAPGMAPEKTGTLKTYAFGEGGISVYSDE